MTRIAAACSPVIEQLESRQMLAVTLADGVLSVRGSARPDIMSVRTAGQNLVVKIGNGRARSFRAADVDLVDVRGGSGADRINVKGRISNVVINGGGGNDQIVGSSRNDFILGGSGNDTINGSNGHDQIYGDAGDDNLSGGLGNDTLGGDDEDNLTPIAGMVGNDTLNGGAGHDWLLSGQETDADLSPDDGIQAGINDPSGSDMMTGGDGTDVIDIRGRDGDGFEVGDGDTITDDEEIVPVFDTAGPEQGEDDLIQHKHAFIKIFIDGVLIDIPDGAGQFGGEPVVHTHEAPNPLDVRGYLLHFHNTDDSGGAGRVFRLRDFFEHWGISFSRLNLGRFRVDADNPLTMRVRPRGQTTWLNNTEFGQYAIQTQHNAGDTQYDQIEIRYNTPTPP
jgi:hypothetical protein